ncbi:MAG: homoserine dehydrogenase [Thermoplasmata archaeon]|nr:homoserine dehydrogenase [Thermoplasmata archaeon]
MILRLAIIGFGNVGQGFARMLLDKREWLLKTKGLDVEIVAISTRSRGSLISDRGLDIERVLDLLANGKSLDEYGDEATECTARQIIDRTIADMMIELTTLNIEDGQPATDHISHALSKGMDVVTANKGPIAFAYHDLRTTSRSMGSRFRFEGTVMDGTPIFSLIEKTLPGCEVIDIRGILNSTSNYVLTAMTNGRSMKDAVMEAQAKGIAEADPTLDLEGWDAAAKITALANVLMDARMTPRDVDRTGIKGITAETMNEAARQDNRIRLVASASRNNDDVVLRVKPESVSSKSPFWSVNGTSSAITIRTDLMGELTILETNPELTQTAYAVFSDMLHIVESIRSGTL